MKNNLLLAIPFVAFLFFFNKVNAQQNVYVDFKKVKEEVQNSKGPYCYNKLESRLKNLDSTLTETEMYYLYYGSSILDKNVTLDTDNTLEPILSKKDKSSEDMQAILNHSVKRFQNNPMYNLGSIRFLLIMYYRLEKFDEYEKIGIIYKRLLDAILSTGNGVDVENAIDIISVDDEYTMLQVFGMTSMGQSLINENGRPYDKLQCKFEDGETTHIYFDVTRVFEGYSKMFDEKK